MRRAGHKLHYHNGFIQISDDQRVTEEVEAPFLGCRFRPRLEECRSGYEGEAIDQQDSGGKDPALYAAKAPSKVAHQNYL